MNEKPKRRWLSRYPLFAEQVGQGLIVAWFVVPAVIAIAVGILLQLIAKMRN